MITTACNQLRGSSKVHQPAAQQHNSIPTFTVGELLFTWLTIPRQVVPPAKGHLAPCSHSDLQGTSSNDISNVYYNSNLADLLLTSTNIVLYEIKFWPLWCAVAQLARSCVSVCLSQHYAHAQSHIYLVSRAIHNKKLRMSRETNIYHGHLQQVKHCH